MKAMPLLSAACLVLVFGCALLAPAQADTIPRAYLSKVCWLHFAMRDACRLAPLPDSCLGWYLGMLQPTYSSRNLLGVLVRCTRLRQASSVRYSVTEWLPQQGCTGAECCCVDQFIYGFPKTVIKFDVSFSGFSQSYWKLHNLTLDSQYLPGSGQQTYSGLPTWCVSTGLTLSNGNYPNSSLYPYNMVPPGIVTNAAGDLNQIAWMMNNIFVGQTTPVSGTNYTWNGTVYPNCSTTAITAQDYQQAVWIIVGSSASNTCNVAGSLGTQCAIGLQGPPNLNACNVAFILNSAFAAVSKGCVPALGIAACLRIDASAILISDNSRYCRNNYTVPSSTCGGVSPHVPIVVDPNPAAYPKLQPLIFDAKLTDWGVNCSCVGGAPCRHLLRLQRPGC